MKKAFGLNYSGGLKFAFIYSLPVEAPTQERNDFAFVHKILACKCSQFWRHNDSVEG